MEPGTKVKTMQKLIRAVTWYYRKDPTRASVICSQLENMDWYISIVRYQEKFGEGKEVVTKIRFPDFELAIKGIKDQFIIEANDIRIVSYLRGEVITVPIEHIHIEPRTVNRECVEQYKSAREKLIKVDPLKLRLDDVYEQVLVNGYQRLMAAKELGLDVINCIFV